MFEARTIGRHRPAHATSLLPHERRGGRPPSLGAGRYQEAPRIIGAGPSTQLASLLTAIDEIVGIDEPEKVVRRAVEVARENIGLVHTALFLLEPSRRMMVGTWGTDSAGVTYDQRHIVYRMRDAEREAFRRAKEEGQRFVVFDNLPIMERRGPDLGSRARGWLAATPILAGGVPVGILFNDAGSVGAALDETKQAHAAILCSFLGATFDVPHALSAFFDPSSRRKRRLELVSAAVDMLRRDPAVPGTALAREIHVSPSHLARTFKAEAGVSLTDYRNRLRLERFDALLRAGGTARDVARAAGFGSYRQFYRVFRQVRRASPRCFLQPR